MDQIAGISVIFGSIGQLRSGLFSWCKAGRQVTIIRQFRVNWSHLFFKRDLKSFLNVSQLKKMVNSIKLQLFMAAYGPAPLIEVSLTAQKQNNCLTCNNRYKHKDPLFLLKVFRTYSNISSIIILILHGSFMIFFYFFIVNLFILNTKGSYPVVEKKITYKKLTLSILRLQII